MQLFLACIFVLAEIKNEATIFEFEYHAKKIYTIEIELFKWCRRYQILVATDEIRGGM